jgi:asparaginyl-tRNA synthetase
MKRSKINLITQDLVNTEILLRGWVRTKRDSKTFCFINLNDGSNLNGIQIIADNTLANYTEIQKINTGSSIEVRGLLVVSQGSNQSLEVKATQINIYGYADPESYPIQKKKMTLEFLREIAHFRPRTNTYSAVFRIRHNLAFAIHKFFNERQFKYIHTPIITGADCEGAGEMFQVTTLNLNKIPKNADGTIDFSQDFFGKSTNLTVSGQLAVENFCAALGDVYTFGPTFRAENSNTTRHLAEFWMVEPEMAFADLNDNMVLAEDFLRYIIKYALEHSAEDLEFLNKMYDNTLLERLNVVSNSAFAHVSYTEAVEILQKSGKKFEYLPSWGIDLQTEHERFLCEEYFKKPTIVTDYPKEIKSFYMKLNEDGKTVRAMDVLCSGIGEIIGGSQREDNYDKLLKRMTELNLPSKDYDWYLDLRKFGTMPHCGFGLGFERAVQYITGMTNIKDVIPFPRYPKHAEF